MISRNSTGVILTVAICSMERNDSDLVKNSDKRFLNRCQNDKFKGGTQQSLYNCTGRGRFFRKESEKNHIPLTSWVKKTMESQTVHPTVYTDRYTQAHPHKHRPPGFEYTSKICTLPTNFLQHSPSWNWCVYSIFQLYLCSSHHPGCLPLVCPQAASRCAGSSNSCPRSPPHLCSPRRLGPRPTATGPGGRAGSAGPRGAPARASRIRATQKPEESLARGAAAGAQQRHRDTVPVSLCMCARVCACVAAWTSGPAFLKPHWVCSEEGPTPAHRLTATKEGRENARRGERRERREGGGGEEEESERETRGARDHTRARAASQRLSLTHSL